MDYLMMSSREQSESHITHIVKLLFQQTNMKYKTTSVSPVVHYNKEGVGCMTLSIPPVVSVSKLL
jgi:hypothetical protein